MGRAVPSRDTTTMAVGALARSLPALLATGDLEGYQRALDALASLAGVAVGAKVDPGSAARGKGDG